MTECQALRLANLFDWKRYLYVLKNDTMSFLDELCQKMPHRVVKARALVNAVGLTAHDSLQPLRRYRR